MGSTLNLTMRPKVFDEIIGLEKQVAALKSKLASGDVPRCFMLTGPFGCGKTTLAYIIAKEIQGWDFQGNPQIQEVNSANITGIDAMRRLADSAGSYPMIGKYGVILLDEMHKLSKPAQELLLKEFEVVKSPTVWICCTTEPQKVATGIITGGRTFNIPVTPLEADDRKLLVERAAKELNHEGDITDFLAALTKGQIGSPRRILAAFESYHAGLDINMAIAGVGSADLPEFHDIAFAVCYGQWDKDAVIPWMGNKPVEAAGTLLKKLDEQLKKKPKATDDTEEVDGTLDDEDLQTKPEIARALRGVVGAFLKGMLLPKVVKGKYVHKSPDKLQKVYEAMHVLANVVPPGAFELEWSGTIAALYRVNQKLQGK